MKNVMLCCRYQVHFEDHSFNSRLPINKKESVSLLLCILYEKWKLNTTQFFITMKKEMTILMKNSTTLWLFLYIPFFSFNKNKLFRFFEQFSTTVSCFFYFDLSNGLKIVLITVLLPFGFSQLWKQIIFCLFYIPEFSSINLI